MKHVNCMTAGFALLLLLLGSFGARTQESQNVVRKTATICRGDTTFHIDFGAVEPGQVLKITVKTCSRCEITKGGVHPASSMGWKGSSGTFMVTVPGSEMSSRTYSGKFHGKMSCGVAGGDDQGPGGDGEAHDPDPIEWEGTATASYGDEEPETKSCHLKLQTTEGPVRVGQKTGATVAVTDQNGKPLTDTAVRITSSGPLSFESTSNGTSQKTTVTTDDSGQARISFIPRAAGSLQLEAKRICSQKKKDISSE